MELNSNWGTICTLVEMKAKDGKIRTADTKGILRIIQSIPSAKAEPFKLWLAQVGSERLDEIINPELAINRAKETYIKKAMRKHGLHKDLNLQIVGKSLRITGKKEAQKIEIMQY